MGDGISEEKVSLGNRRGTRNVTKRLTNKPTKQLTKLQEAEPFFRS
jgi:hypothetical protein